MITDKNFSSDRFETERIIKDAIKPLIEKISKLEAEVKKLKATKREIVYINSNNNL